METPVTLGPEGARVVWKQSFTEWVDDLTGLLDDHSTCPRGGACTDECMAEVSMSKEQAFFDDTTDEIWVCLQAVRHPLAQPLLFSWVPDADHRSWRGAVQAWLDAVSSIGFDLPLPSAP